MAISCSLLQWAAGASISKRLGGVSCLSVETNRVAALVGAVENAVTLVLASLVSGYKRCLFLTRRSSRHILLGRLWLKVKYLLVQHLGAAVLIVMLPHNQVITIDSRSTQYDKD